MEMNLEKGWRAMLTLGGTRFTLSIRACKGVRNMTYTGTIHGTTIQFDQQLPFTEGVQVVVEIHPPASPRKGSPQAWLTHLAGTLTSDEGQRILAGATACRTIDAALWPASES